jgi:hypothetical protein
VVDVSNDWTRVELQIAWSKLGPNRVLDISDRPDASIGAGHVLKRPRGALSESEQFLQQVSDWFATQAQTYLLPLEEEPDRLLEMGYSRAAVIAATTLLETRLRERLNLMSVPNRPMGFVQLVRLAVENGALTLERGNVVNEWAKLRNLAVHTAKTISMKEARIVVHGIKKLIDELKAR